MTELDRLIQKHRVNGLLIDSNLLVLLIVGRTNRHRVSQFKRTNTYTYSDYELLELFVSFFERTLITPNVATEVSNLTDLSGNELAVARQRLQEFVVLSDERYAKSQSVVRTPAFPQLGLTDAALASLGDNALVLTDDLSLFSYLTHIGIDAINFAYIRGAMSR